MKRYVYSKDGSQKAVISSLEYQGVFMGLSCLSVTVKSPVPVAFANGDYIDYRGDRFTLRYLPALKKQSAPMRYGEAFVYEGIVFYSGTDDLTRCDFLDVVLSDNKMHFTSLPTFQFYAETADDLAGRIQANLDRLYKGDRKWTVKVAEGTVVKPYNFSFSNVKVWDALTEANKVWKLNFVIRGRVITIGGKGSTIAQEFRYGKSNGLLSIEQTVNSDDAIITRLRAYGSTRNIPYRYYNNLSGVLESMYVPNLMLPDFGRVHRGGSYDYNGCTVTIETTVIEGKQVATDVYIDSPETETYGINEGTVFFDGSGEEEEIYPSMEGMTAEILEEAGYKIELADGDNGNLDEIVSAQQLSDSGVLPEDGTDLSPSYFTITLKDLGFDINDYLTDETAQISMKSGMCVGRTFDITNVVKSGINYVLTVNRTVDDSIQQAFPNRDFNLSPGDKFVLLGISMPDAYINAASQKLLSEATAWLRQHDHTKPSFTPAIDNKFMAEHPDIAETIKEGDLFVFSDADLGIDTFVTISSLTTKEGEGMIPQYEVTLNDETEADFVDRVASEVSQMMSTGSPQLTKADITSLIRSYGANMFVSKITDDTVAGLLSFAKGLQSTGYTSGTLGTGFGLFKDVDGMSYLELDRLYVRYKAIFDTLEVKHISHVGGEFVVSPAGMECIRVEKVSGIPSAWQPLADSQGRALYDKDGKRLNAVAQRSDAYRCHFRATDGDRTIENQFAVGDQAMCREFNLTGGSVNRYYWRKVIGVGADYIDLSVTDCLAGSDTPIAGDSIVTVGNDRDTTRRHAIVISSYGGNAPSIMLYTGINSYSLEGKAIFEVTPEGVNIKVGSFNGTFTGKFNIEVGSTGLENMEGYGDLTDAIAEAVDNAEQAAADAQAATDELDKISSDGYISPPERTALKQQHADIQSEYSQIIADAARYGVSYTAYTNAYMAADEALEKYTLDTPEYRPVMDDYADIAAYYPARQAILDAIAEAAKQGVDDVAEDLAGYKTTVSAQFTVLTKAVNSKVSQTTFDNYGTSVAEQFTEISQTVDNISLTVQSLGRNLFLNSGLQLGTEHWRLFNTGTGNSLTADRSTGELTVKSTGNNVLYNDFIDVAAGEQFTLSGEAYAATAVSLNYNYLMYESGGNVQIYPSSAIQLAAGQWTKFSITFKASRAGKASAGAGFMANTTVKFRRLKWERGAIATDWNEADGDAPEQLAVTGIYVEEGIIRLRADNTYFTNSSGGQVAVFTADGKLSVDLIDVDELVAKRVKTAESGRRVVIEGNELSMFNDSNELRMKVTGGNLSNTANPGSVELSSPRISLDTPTEGLQGKTVTLATFSLASANNEVTIPEIRVTVTLRKINDSNTLTGHVSLRLDRRSIANWRLETQSGKSETFTMQSYKTSLPAGNHTLSLFFRTSGNATQETAEARAGASNPVSWVYSDYVTEVASDGFRAASGAGKFLKQSGDGTDIRAGAFRLSVTEGGLQLFAGANTSIYLTENGIQYKVNGVWKELT